MATSLRESNIKYADVEAHVTRVLAANEHFYAGIRIRCVAIQSATEWYAAFCAIQAFTADSAPPKEPSREYSTSHLLEAWLLPQDLAAFLRELTSKSVLIDSHRVALGSDLSWFMREYKASTNEYSSYPGHVFQTSSPLRVTLPEDPLLTYELPFYADVKAALWDWSGFSLPLRSVDSLVGRVALFLPECRARFREFKYADQTVTATVVTADKLPETLQVKGSWQRLDSVRSFECPVVDHCATAKVPFDSEAVELYLVGSDGEVYDWHKESRLWSRGQERILRIADETSVGEAAILRAIRTGEGDTIEFKEYVEPRNPKEYELIKTAIAFANSRGGSIFIGVDDECSIVGIEKKVWRSKEATDTASGLGEALAKYAGRVRQAIAGALNRIPEIDVEIIGVEGHSILLVRVAEGDQKPYFDRERKIPYIRRGANNLVPHPDYDLPELLRSERDDEWPLVPFTLRPRANRRL